MLSHREFDPAPASSGLFKSTILIFGNRRISQNYSYRVVYFKTKPSSYQRLNDSSDFFFFLKKNIESPRLRLHFVKHSS